MFGHSSDERRFSGVFKFAIAALILYVVGIPLTASILTRVFGSAEEAINSVIHVIPMGEGYYNVAGNLVNKLFSSQTAQVSQESVFTFSYILKNMKTMIFTLVIFELINLIVFKILHLTESDGRKRIGMTVIAMTINAVLAAVLAPALINYVFANIHRLSGAGSALLSLAMSAVYVGGATAVAFFIFSFTMINAVLYVIIKLILVNTVKISICYVFLLMVLIGIEEKLYLMIFGAAAGLLVILLILGALDLVIDILFDKS